MTSLLPPHPSFRFLQEQAKDLLKAHRRGDAQACAILRLLRRFHAADDARIMASDVALHDVQFALAMDYGFASWPAMKAFVEAREKADRSAAGVGDGSETRRVLQGVPKVGYHRRQCPFPACVEAVLEYLNRPEPYDYLMGVSGAPFRRVWNRDDGGNVDLMHMRPEPYRLLFQAVGLDYRVVPRVDRAAMIEAVKESIAAGKPAIAFGIIGPPEAGIVAGYDQGGDVLLGHSFFDFTPRPDGGYYEKAGWFEEMERGAVGMIVLGDDRPRPTERETLVASLKWAVDLARVERRPYLPDHVCGLAACDAWADALEIDVDYEGDGALTSETRAMVHVDQCTMLYERVYAAAFLRRMAPCAPEAADELLAAADEYERIGNAARKVWPWKAMHYMAEEVRQGLRDAAQRRQFAREARAAGRLEATAVRRLEVARDRMQQEQSSEEMR